MSLLWSFSNRTERGGLWNDSRFLAHKARRSVDHATLRHSATSFRLILGSR